ncbi:hypothetical protein NVI2019_GHJFPKLH_01999 [Providencia alcalifaciens]|nr:hypothetical protein NVI2019_GHJFPKLH_01999 [Providencia alcalifaciens]
MNNARLPYNLTLLRQELLKFAENLNVLNKSAI